MDLGLPAPPAFAAHSRRTIFRLWSNQVWSGLAVVLALLTFVPLFSILFLVVEKGLAHLSLETFTTLPPAPGQPGNGIGNAIAGTAMIVALALAMAAPVGVLAAVFICEYQPASTLANAVRFTAKLLTGIPSIICGVFAYAVIVVTTHHASAFAGAVALAVLALPVVLLTSEQALLGVPKALREASLGLGASTFQTVWRIVLPEAFPAILTGIMLALARAAGETAPLLFTASFNNFWSRSIMEPSASLSVLINNFATQPDQQQVGLAWTASLVLVVVVTITNVISQLIFARR